MENSKIFNKRMFEYHQNEILRITCEECGFEIEEGDVDLTCYCDPCPECGNENFITDTELESKSCAICGLPFMTDDENSYCHYDYDKGEATHICSYCYYNLED